jgi:dTDP-glucose 4,6-dehydratase
MKILVTGGAGFIGSSLVLHLVQDLGYEVVNVDAMTYAANPLSLAALNDNPLYRLIEADIMDGGRMRSAFGETQPDAVLHLAAESHVDRSIAGPGAFVRTNVLGTQVLLEATRAYYDKLIGSQRETFRFLHVSTDEVFGSLGEEGFFTENSPYQPRSPYAASKAAADHLVAAWGHTYGLPILISNCSNNYGPRQFPEKLIPLCILNALEGKPLPLYGDGLNRRDWLHVDDHVRALTLILHKGKVGETYAIGARCELTNKTMMQEICALLDELRPATAPYATLITPVADRPGHDRRYAIDPTKIESEFGWRPLKPFTEGLRTTVEWYLDNQHWWQPLRDSIYNGERLGLL